MKIFGPPFNMLDLVNAYMLRDLYGNIKRPK